jgi:hypothetical protein
MLYLVILINIRRSKYCDLYININKLCSEYNQWQFRNGLNYFDNKFENAYHFCRNEFPLEITNKLLFSLKKLDMKTLFTNDMKIKFEKYLMDNR